MPTADNDPPGSAKKGSSGWKMAGMGCLSLFLLACLGILDLVRSCSSSVQQHSADVQNHPVREFARQLAMMNRNLEVVSTDETSKAMTLRNKQTGAVGTDLFEAVPTGTPIPSWVPPYPGASAKEGGMRMIKAGHVTGMAMVESTDPLSDVKAFYDATLRAADFMMGGASSKIKTPFLEMESAFVTGDKDLGTQRVAAFIDGGKDKTSIVLIYSGPE